MFLNTGNLNEGGCRDKCAEGRKRELREGNNPKIQTTNWQDDKNSLHVNTHWQKLRN
jgi:hypothetical protein